MDKWYGAAGVCAKEGKILMVLQGKIEEPKCWSVPSGGIEREETAEHCCIREVKEETGYDVEIVRPLFIKENEWSETHYFEMAIVGGEPAIQDPDALIYDIDWKSSGEISNLPLTYKKDRAFLMEFLKGIKE